MAEPLQIICPRCRTANLMRARFCMACRAEVVLNNERPTPDGLQYRLTRIIKQGGQGAVYEGIDQYGRVYAVKEMLDRAGEAQERAEALARFNSEAELLQKLTHRRIPRVYSHFTDDGRHYLTMDFVRGEDLEQIVDRSGRLPEPRVMEIAGQICDVLSYLHGRGLIYRDMKPSNVMIEQDGGVKLIDFGIAKLFSPTVRGTQIGTPGYAPPEQYQGLATPQSDVYALAATLHHLLTGRDPTRELPFVFPPAHTVEPSVSLRTSAALEQALQKVANDRFTTIAAFWRALQPAAAPQPVTTRPAVPAATPQPITTRPAVPAATPQPVTTRPAAAQPIPPRPSPATAAPTAAAALPRVAVPAAAQLSAPPAAPAPTAAGAPGAPAAPTATAPVTRRPSGRGAGQVVVILLLLLLTAGLIVASNPAMSSWLSTQLSQFTAPGWPSSTPAPVSSFSVNLVLTVTVPVGTSDAALREAFDARFTQRVTEAYGATAAVNRNVPPVYSGGTPREVARDGNMVTYEATLVGWVSVR